MHTRKLKLGKHLFGVVGLLLLLLLGTAGGAAAAVTLTVASASVDTTGRVVTVTISGASGALSPSSGVTGFSFSVAPTNYNPDISSATVSGSTVVLALNAEIQSTDTVTVSLVAGSNLRDASANTAVAVSNASVSNSSTQVGTDVNVINSVTSFDFNMQVISTGWFGQGGTAGSGSQFTYGGESAIEFTANCTTLEGRGYYQGQAGLIVDGITRTVPSAALDGNQYLVLVSGLSAGPHFFQYTSPAANAYFNGFRLTGGTHSVIGSGAAKTLFADNVSAIGYPNAPSIIARWGGYTASSTLGYGIFTGPYNGAKFELGFTGTDLDFALVYDQSSMAISVDGASEQLITESPSSSLNNGLGYLRVAHGLTPGSHTIKIIQVGGGYNTGSHDFEAVRVLNGTRLASATTAGNTSFSVSRIGNLVVGAWIKIDTGPLLELRQVTAVSSTTLTVAALTNAHAQFASVTSSLDTPGTISAYSPDKPTSGKRIVAMGDSNTQGANPSGFAGTPDAGGIYYTSYDSRASYLDKAALSLGWEAVNTGVQGTDTNVQAARAADISAYSRASCDYVIILEGTNDINGNTITQSQVQTNIQTQVNAAAAVLRPKGKIILVPPQTPQGATSGTGLNIAGVASAMQTIAASTASYSGTGTYTGAGYNTFVVYASHAWDGLNLTAYNATTNPTGDIFGSLHFQPSGHTKLAANLVKYYLSPASLFRSRSSGGPRPGSRSPF